MSVALLALVVLAILIVSIGAAVIRHKGDLFAWSRHPATRVVFGLAGLSLVAVTLVPEIKSCLRGPTLISSVAITVPEQSLQDRFPVDSAAPSDGQEIKWTKGRLIANFLFLNEAGQVVACDSATIDRNSASALKLKGSKKDAGGTCEYGVKIIDDIVIKRNGGRCFISVNGRTSLKSYNSRSSGGVNDANASEMFVLGEFHRPKHSGFQIRRASTLAQISHLVLLLHPLNELDAATKTVDANTYLAPLMGKDSHRRRGQAHHTYSRSRPRSSPPLFKLVGSVGLGPFVLLGGFVLLALIVVKHRAAAVFAALFVTSFTLIGIDGVATHRALAVVSDESFTGYERAEMLDHASKTFFHAGRVTDHIKDLMKTKSLPPEARRVALEALVNDELDSGYEKHRAGLTQIASGFDHYGARTWYSLWAVPTGTREHLLVTPYAFGDHDGMLWYRAAIAVAGVPPGIVVFREHSSFAAGEMFARVAASQDEIDAAIELASGDESEFLKSDLWIKRIAPKLTANIP